MNAAEHSDSFACFGARCTVHVTGNSRARSGAQALTLARERLLSAHNRFSRFTADSELSRLNADSRAEVPASEAMIRFAAAVRDAGETSEGLVDGTLVAEIRAAGYDGDETGSLPLTEALALAPPRQPAGPAPEARWRLVRTRPERGTIERPPGVGLDSGGLVKGLLADLVAAELFGHASFAVNCAGDLALGGTLQHAREVKVASPFDGSTLHSFRLRSGGIATSGIGRRAWRDAQGRAAHHLLDPATGRPAYTGIVQATALAATASRPRCAPRQPCSSGPARAAHWLPDGGVIVLDDGTFRVVEPPLRIALSQLSAFAQPRPTRALQHR